MLKNRIIKENLKIKHKSKSGRIITLTGARQTGKTTLAKNCFKEYDYISFEDPVLRPQYSNLSAKQFYSTYPQAVIDEVQKIPKFIETIKAVYDDFDDAKYIILGSSQILMISKVGESLAGRVSIIELMPLTLPEMITNSWDEPITESRFISWLRNGFNLAIFNGIPQNDVSYSKYINIINDYLQFGSMPALTDTDITSEEKYDWLHNYLRTYLQRDLQDLAQIQDLESFLRAQKTLSNLTGQILNYNKIAQLSGISPKTAKRFISYLELSYQVFVVKPWFSNINKRLSKSPKIHFVDPGIQRALLNRTGQVTGNEFESAIIAEIYKQLITFRINSEMYHLRTLDGKEIDLVIETEEGYILFGIKQSSFISKKDAKHLKAEGIFDKPVIHSFLLSNDHRIISINDKITAMPIGWFLGN